MSLGEDLKKDQPFSTHEESQKSITELTFKQQAGDAANKWLARNRSLVLRQTPFWVQGLAALLIGVSGTALLVGIFFRIDEVVTVQGQLKSIGGTISVKTPAGGKVAEVLFTDGSLVKKGEKLLRFDTRKASEDKLLLSNLIEIEKKQLNTQIKTINSQKMMLVGRIKVLERRIKTKKSILTEMASLVKQGGFQRLQYLEQSDELFQLENQQGELLEEKSQLVFRSDEIRLRSLKDINQMQSRLKEAELQLQYQNVVAPISGIIFDPQATVDGVINPGERIVSIVPQQGLFAEV